MEAVGARTRAAGRRTRLPAASTEERSVRRRIKNEESAVFHSVVSFSPDPLPDRYYDKETSKPISFYFSSLEELLTWIPGAEDSFNVALEPLACRQPPLSSQRPRTLLCHDMMGGYLDDRFIQGCAVQNPYAFYHWQNIDIFVYFSHHTITIPPVGWTNAAHRNGVCVLGTLITEWKEGGQLCEAFLAGEEHSYQAVADQLVLIAQFFRFDGWLINIENSLSLAAVGNTPPFLRYLTSQLHQQVPGGLVLWYDSVLTSGQLKWQDELNTHNRVFFDSCDGFFTNYNWQEAHLERMLGQVGQRQADVYVGVDVFARGNVIGGRFDTNKDHLQKGHGQCFGQGLRTVLARGPASFMGVGVGAKENQPQFGVLLPEKLVSLELIRKHGFSAALFAPGWVYECLEKKDFFQNQDKFWSLLEHHLPTHSICSLPFVTSFCLGMGPRRVCYGQEEAVGPWYHVSAQETQPLIGEHQQAGDSGGWVKTQCCLQDAWHGGSSLLIRGQIPPQVGNMAVRLFSLNVPVPPKLFLSLVYKLEGNSDVRVALELTMGDAESCHIGGISALNAETNSRHSPRPLRVPPTKLTRWVGRCGQPLHGGWVQRCYEVSQQGCLLQDLFVNFSRPVGSQKDNFVCRLGEIQVVDASNPLVRLPPLQAVTVSQVHWQQATLEAEGASTGLQLSCTLHWSYLLSYATCFRIHCQRRTEGAAPGQQTPEPEKPTLLGLAFGNLYRVVDLAVAALGPGHEGRVDFLVEPVPKERFLVPQAEWGQATLLYSMPHSG